MTQALSTHTPWEQLIPLPQMSAGKVRNLFEIPDDDEHLLMVASDRISTHDVIHETEIPGKGENLTALTLFWATQIFKGKIDTHIVAYGKDIYRYINADLPANLHRRAIIVKKCAVPQVEFVWRSYLTGSLYKLYLKGEDPYGIQLSPGLNRMQQFDEDIFTPTVKGKDSDPPLVSSVVAREHARETNTTHRAYRLIAEYLAARGIVLIDAKFEASGRILVDEFGTGDCARMAYARDVARAGQYGEEVAWLDKQVARDMASATWNEKEKYPLTFEPEQVQQIVGRYDQAFVAIVGTALPDWQAQFLD